MRLNDALSLEEKATEVEQLRRSNLQLQQQLARAKAKVDDLVEATIEAARGAAVSIGYKPLVVAPTRDPRKGKGHVALWHLTDWQGGKKTPSYDSEVMVTRVQSFVKKADRKSVV